MESPRKQYGRTLLECSILFIFFCSLYNTNEFNTQWANIVIYDEIGIKFIELTREKSRNKHCMECVEEQILFNGNAKNTLEKAHWEFSEDQESNSQLINSVLI